MEWQLALLLIMGSLIIMMISGLPIAVCFMLVNIIGVYLFWSGEVGLEHLTLSIYDSVTSFSLLPVPLFVLMGEVLLHSGMAPQLMDVVDKWLGRLPGRLGLLAVGSGTVFASLTGNSMASTAMLGSVLAPEMEKRGYRKPMSLGPILGSGCLAIMIPPSGLAVLLGAIGEISIGQILVAIPIPGLLMALLYATYIFLRCKLQPSIAPAYTVPAVRLLEKVKATVRYILPIGVIVFLVVGLIFIGVATPTEAAATGALGVLVLVAAYGRFSWDMLKKSIIGTLSVTVMTFMILVGSIAFSQILAFSGVSRGLVDVALGFPVAPILILIAMQIVLLIMGCFMEIVSIMMITLPIFMPVIHNLGFNEVWFAVIYLLNMEMATITPPLGLTLFVMKGVAPPDTTMEDIYKAALPFVGCDLIAMALIIAFPAIALWLPRLMG